MQFSILIIFLCLSFSIFGQADKDGGFSVMKTKNPNVNQMKDNKSLGASTWEKTKNPNVKITHIKKTWIEGYYKKAHKRISIKK